MSLREPVLWHARRHASSARPARVIASDISTGMLANVPIGADAGLSAPIELLESSAIAIDLPDAVVDIALCQQGFPFIPDREAAAREMHRVLRPGGTIGVAVWAAGRRLEPFDSYGEVLIDAGFDTPSIRARPAARYPCPRPKCETVLSAAIRRCRGRAAGVGAPVAFDRGCCTGIIGTPYWPVIDPRACPARGSHEHTARDIYRNDGQPIRQTSIAVLGRGTVE